MKVHIDNTTLNVDKLEPELRRQAKHNNEKLVVTTTISRRINKKFNNRRKD